MKGFNVMFFAGVAAMLLPSCNDLLGDIYDEPVASSEYGFIETCSGSKPGMIYVDATDYEVWTYISFADRTIEPLPVDAPAPEKWDMAVHRYDTKTNGGVVFATSLSDISLAQGWRPSAGEKGVADIWTTDKIVTDMSTMMDGYLSYADSYYNPVLSEWLDVDTSTMPPVYTLSGKVYVIEMADGRKAAVKLSDFMNGAGVKGYMSIQYIYPLQ